MGKMAQAQERMAIPNLMQAAAAKGNVQMISAHYKSHMRGGEEKRKLQDLSTSLERYNL